MRNPWSNLPTRAPFILENDREALRKLDSSLRARGRKGSLVRDEIIPEPFVGNPFTADVVLLNLNPGFEKSDRKWHRSPTFRKAAIENLNHRKMDYPFYLLDPRFKDSGGAKYWRKRMRSLIERYGDRKVANAICVIEWHPYHSEISLGHPTSKFCDSQDYTAWLVKQAKKRDGCVVLLLRSRRQWQSLVPESSDWPIVNSVQSAYLTENNTSRSPGLWQRIEAAVSSQVDGAQK